MATRNSTSTAVANDDWQDDAPGDWQDDAPLNRTPSQPPGFLKRFGQAVGFPTSIEEAKAMQPTTAEKIGGPAVVAGKMLLDWGHTMADAAHRSAIETADAIKNIRAGEPVGPNVAKVAGGGLDFALNGVLAPVGGGAIQRGGEDVMRHMDPGQTFPHPDAMLHPDVAGDLLGTFVNLWTLDKAGPADEAKAVNNLTRVGGGSVRASKAAEALVKRLRAEETAKPVKTVGDALDVVKTAKDKINKEYGNAIGPYANQPFFPMDASGQPVIPQRILALKNKFSTIDQSDRSARAMIDRAAADYSKPLTLGDLDTKRTRLNAELSSLNSKNPSARYTARNGNVQSLIDTTIQDALRETVYPEADRLAGVAPGHFEHLKQQQMHLMAMEGEMDKTIDMLRAKTRAAAGTSPIERLSTGATAESGGSGFLRVGGITKAMKSPDFIGRADRSAARAFKKPSPMSKGFLYSLPVRMLDRQQPKEWWEPDNGPTE